MRRKWSYWAYLLYAIAVVALVVILKCSDEDHLVVVRVILAEISVICWAFQVSLTLTTIGPSLRRIQMSVNDVVAQLVLGDRLVERRIWMILIVSTVLLTTLMNVTFALRDMSMLIPVVYFFVVSIIVTLTSPWTSRILLQRVVNAALADSKLHQEHRLKNEKNPS